METSVLGALRTRGRGGRAELSREWKGGRNGEDDITEGLIGQGKEVWLYF